MRSMRDIFDLMTDLTADRNTPRDVERKGRSIERTRLHCREAGMRIYALNCRAASAHQNANNATHFGAHHGLL